MKKLVLSFIVVAELATVNMAQAAVAIKKAAPVAKTETTSSTTASLIPTVLSLYSGAQEISKKQKEITAECQPTSQEIQWVNNIIKEWAKTGAMTPGEIEKRLGRKACPGGTGYQASATNAAITAGAEICFDNYAAESDKNQIWYGYPKVGTASYCSDGSFNCKEKKSTTDMYDLFNLVDFSEADYTKQEATMAAKLIAKVEQCSYSKLSAKKRALWGEFLTGTLSTVGQSTNTGQIMQSVGGIAGSGGGLGGLSSIGSLATQFLNK